MRETRFNEDSDNRIERLRHKGRGPLNNRGNIKTMSVLLRITINEIMTIGRLNALCENILSQLPVYYTIYIMYINCLG